jgi:hypothetical protein
MRIHRINGALQLIGRLVVGIGLSVPAGALAQATSSPSPSTTAVVATKTVTLTPEEQGAQADAILRRATQLGERLTRMLDEATREKDILRASCVNRKLTEVNANTRNIEQRTRALKDAIAVGDEARRSHEYTVLTVLAAKLESLNQEASQCLGQSVYEPGASQVTTTVPNSILSIPDPTIVPPPTVPPPSITVPPFKEPASGAM